MDESGALDTVEFHVPTMDCQDCAKSITAQLEDLDGIESHTISVPQQAVTIQYNPTKTSRSAITNAINHAGYTVTEPDEHSQQPQSVWTTRRGIFTIIGSIFLIIGIGLDFIFPEWNLIVFNLLTRDITLAWLAYGSATAIVGHIIVRNGYYAALNLDLNIQLLMSIGILSALIINLPFEAATLAVLFSIAELLERFSIDRAQESLHELIELTPDTTTRLEDDSEHTVPVETLTPGDVIVARPGTRIPTDGTVTAGSSAVDESPVTGESMPVDKTPGDTVYSGSIVQSGYLEITVSVPADESTIAKVIELVENAQQGTTSYERFVDRFATYYTPLILLGAILTVVFSPFVFGITRIEGFLRGLTLLVIACPCALVISTPVSIVSGVTSGARNGVLIKSGDDLEQSSQIDAIAFDKTGTLTTGEPTVTNVIPLGEKTETEVLEIASGLEHHSEHPLADAIVSYTDRRTIQTPDVRAFESIPGQGVKGTISDDEYYVGKPGLFEELHPTAPFGDYQSDGGEVVIDTESAAIEDATTIPDILESIEATGNTVVLVGTQTEIIGIIAVADALRPEAKSVIAQLHARGFDEITMLTGDNEATAKAIGTELGIDTVHADLLPAEKVDAIHDLRKTHGRVAMVGDGINDGPALAAADIGIAMGAAGTDTAIEVANVALMADELTKLPYLFSLAAKTDTVIKQNVLAAILVKGILAVGAPFGFVSVITAIVIGDMGMSLGITSNALRLARIRP